MNNSRFNLKLQKLNFDDSDKKKEFNYHLFSEVASKYNFLTKVLSFGRDGAWKKLLIKRLPSIENAKCLDIASGTGDITFLLAKKYPNGIITGIDLNEEMIDRAKKLNKYNNVGFMSADMCNTGLKDSYYNIITGGYALRNAPDLNVALLEIKRLLKNGGYAVFLDFSKSANKIIQKISLFFLKFWGSVWGIILHGNPDVYGYIADSLNKFPDRIKIKLILKECGFNDIKSKKLFFGFLELISFKK